MKQVVIFLHYGSKTIFTGDALYKDIECKAQKSFPDSDIFTVYCSQFLEKMIKQNNAELLTLDSVSSIIPNYDKVVCVPSYLTSGSEWQRVKTFLSQYDNITIKEPFLERFTKQITEIILQEIRTVIDFDTDILFIGHGGKGSNTKSYDDIYNIVKEEFSQSQIILLEETETHIKILEKITKKNAYFFR